MHSIWKMFEKTISKYPKVFPKKFIDATLFLNLYGQVCQKNYGDGLNSASLIPMADSFNHHSLDNSNELICLPLHPDGDQNIDYYRIEKFMTDFSAIFKKHGWTD